MRAVTRPQIRSLDLSSSSISHIVPFYLSSRCGPVSRLSIVALLYLPIFQYLIDLMSHILFPPEPASAVLC